MKKLIYRFRSAEALLRTWKELEQQTVYFATSKEQNDPMEGIINLRWQGDALLWRNFYSHFFRCLYLSYLQYVIDQNAKIEIPVFASSKSFPGMDNDRQYKLARARFFSLCDVRKSAKLLGQRTRSMGEKEVCTLFQILHRHALWAILRTLKAADLPEFGTPTGKYDLCNQIEAIDQLVMRQPDEEKLEALHRKTLSAFDQITFLHAYNAAQKGKKFTDNQILLTITFAADYLEAITSLVSHDCYAACFVRGYTNSSMWAHYAASHTGACLIFEVDEEDAESRLRMHGVVGYGNSGHLRGERTFQLKEVSYTSKHNAIDFFSTLGRLPLGVIEKDWFREGNKQTTKEVGAIRTDSDEWRSKYWDGLEENALIKTKDWAYEEEVRALLFGALVGREPAERTFCYDFSSLKGIIFGIKMGEDDKNSIANIIESKCRNERRKDFEFYQAYFDHSNSRVQIEKMEFLKFSDIQ